MDDVMIPADFVEQINRCMADGERGGLLLLSEDGGIVFRIRVAERQYLGFDYHPDNYPCVSGGIFEMGEDEFARSIQRRYGGWKVVRNNLGVPVDEYGGVCLLEDSVNN